MTDKEQVALENFLLDIECLNELKPWTDDINIFEILKMSKMEIRHSNFLAWLLNPNENHSFGDRILKDVICHIIKHYKADIDPSFSIIDATLWDYESFNVYREKDNMDILIISNVLNVLICIENKVFSQEHTEQTLRYRRKIDEVYPNYKKLFVFLTPYGNEAVDYEYWVPLTYKALIDIIDTLLKSLNITIKEKIYIENYISGVKKYMMDDTKLQEICLRIYSKHRQALDLIFENRPNVRNSIYEVLVEKFEHEATITGNIDFNKNTSTKSLIRFNTPFSLKLFPKLNGIRKSAWSLDFMFWYELNFRGYPLRLSVLMNNNNKNNLSESELEMCKNVCAIIDNKKQWEENWEWMGFNIAKNTKIIGTNLYELSLEEFNEDKENIVNTIYNNVMKAIRVFEDKLKKAGL